MNETIKITSERPRQTLAMLYQRARYRVQLPNRQLELRVGEPARSLELELPHAARFALITACNPLGRMHTPLFNRQRQSAFEAQLRDAALDFRPALTGEGAWLEPSVLILDIAASALHRWALRYSQLASLYWRRGQPVSLSWHLGKPDDPAPDLDAEIGSTEHSRPYF